MSEQEAIARAEKQCGYGMITQVATGSGNEDWFGQTNENGMNLQSLNAIMKLNGGKNVTHEDIFQATVKDFAN